VEAEYAKSQACPVCQDPRYKAFLRTMKYRRTADERASTKSRARVWQGSSNHED
jgi:hypothetical protein